MLTHFTKITNDLSSLGNSIDNDQKVKKVIRALPKTWEAKVTTLKELNDREEMDFSGFIRNLKTPREGREPTKKKSISFKATPSIEDHEDSLEEGEEDFGCLSIK